MRSKVRRVLSALLCMVMVLGMLPMNAEAASSTVDVLTCGNVYRTEEWDVLELVNEERAAVGADPLVMSADLQVMAEQRAAELIAYWSHTRPNGTSCFSIFDEAGVTWWSVGENIASGQVDAESVMYSWMHSDGHRANILAERFTHIGIGCFMYGSTKYWVQIFASGLTDKTESTGTTDLIDEPFVIEVDIDNVDEGGIEFYQSEIDMELGDSADYDLMLYGDHWSGWYSMWLGIVLPESIDGGLSFSKENIITVDEEYLYFDAPDCSEELGAINVTATVGTYTATKTINLTCSHPEDAQEVVTVPATCVKEGSKDVTCSKCKKVILSETLPVTDHSFGDWVVTKEATWNEDGEKQRTCSGCPLSETEVIAKLSTGHEHDFTGTETIVTEATCTTAGLKTIACTNASCPEVKEETIDALGHSEKVAVTPASCEEDGISVTSCTRCGDVLSTEVLTAPGHDWTDWTVSKAVTCITDGTESRECNNCNACEDRVVNATGHTPEEEWETLEEATCTAEGKAVIRCAVCEDILSEKAIPMTEHDYTDWEVVKEPTITEEGQKKRGCKDCELLEFETIEKLPEYILGDADNDGDVDVFDARLVLRYAVDDAEAIELIHKIAADFDEDGDIDVFDARAILQYCVSN